MTDRRKKIKNQNQNRFIHPKQNRRVDVLWEGKGRGAGGGGGGEGRGGGGKGGSENLKSLIGADIHTHLGERE